jgi:hypothetical protein
MRKLYLITACIATLAAMGAIARADPNRPTRTLTRIDAAADAQLIGSTFCGAAHRCLPLPQPIVYGFGGRNYYAGYSNPPKPAPYYKLHIVGGGEGAIAVDLIWLPTAQLVRVSEHVTPPNPPYWEPTPPDAISLLKELARRIRPIPASGHWH